jgi:hypothetical protein
VCELFIFDPIFNTLLSILIKLPGSLDIQPKETPGVITNWRCFRGEEKEEAFPGRRHSSSL